MSHTAKLRLWILEFGCCAPRITAEIANVVIRWIGWSFVASKNSLCFVIKRRDYRLISLRVAAKQSCRLECLEVQSIDEGPIVVMIENYRSDLLWRLMRSSPYIIAGLRRAGFSGGWL